MLDLRIIASAPHKLALGGIFAAAALCCAAIIATPHRPKFELSLARVVDVRDTDTQSTMDFRFPIEDTNEDWIVVMRVHNLDSRALTFGRETVQRRASGQPFVLLLCSFFSFWHYQADEEVRTSCAQDR